MKNKKEIKEFIKTSEKELTNLLENHSTGLEFVDLKKHFD